MSGDVQPKKRRDKKKKKDDGAEDIPHKQFHMPPTINLDKDNDDVNIHVQKDSHTGGGYCAKFVFFILLAILAVLIGLIITEHRGLTDLDTAAETESRFSQIFEGWVDDKADDHDDHHAAIEHDDDHDDGHGDDHDEHDDHDDHDEEDEHDDEDDHEDEHSEEEEEEEEEHEDEETAASEEEEEYASEVDENSLQQDEEDDEEDDDDDEVDETPGDVSEEPEESEQDQGDSDNKDDDEQEDSEPANEEEDEEDDDDDQSVQEQDVSEELETADFTNGDDSEEADDKDQSVENANESEEDGNDDKNVEADTEDGDDDEEPTDGEEQNEDDATSGEGKLAASSENQQITTPESEAKSSGGPEEVENVASDFDNLLTGALDTAFDYLNNNVVFALNEFNKILENHPKSPRALYGKARALDSLAEQKRSNKHLQEAVQYYTKVLHAEEVTNALYILAAERCINRIRFLGDYKKTITIHKMLIDRFSTDAKYYNQLAITYLTMNFMNEAREILLDVLTKWPNNGVALVHYGFILKVNDDNLIEAIDYLRRGIKSGEDGVIDGRFYFHLGDALTRLGHKDQAQEIYMDGVSKHIFLSTHQRSLYNVDRLTGRPWWHVDQLPVAYQRQLAQFEAHYEDIRREALAALQPTSTAASLYRDEAENLRAAGHWQQFELYTRGRQHPANCERCPVTCRLVAGWTDAAGCRRGQAKFSVMKPGTKVWPHCGPTNCRLRAHLGLKVPGGTYLRVAEEIRSWEEGKFLIFDDSFEHEVWHNGTDFRLVLIVDIWHPELTSAEKQTLTAI